MTPPTEPLLSIPTLTGTAAASSSLGVIAWTSPLAHVGVPAAVLCMAFTGVACGLLVNKPGGSRKRLYGLALAYTAVSACIAIVVPSFPGLGFLQPVAPAMALLVAFFAQSLIPVIGEALAERLKRDIGGKPQ
ncbi:hypothetical protein ACFQ4Q_07365 [Lysobacter gummosus]|uniref:hypothetical protein n=1 Tax=Lysobacter gummosus TaxID=262324 RepID=UPI003643F413